MQELSDGFVPCLRFPCLLLPHISCPKPLVTNLLLGDVQAEGERVGWRPPALSEKKTIEMPRVVREAQPPLCSAGKERGLSVTAVALLWTVLLQGPPGAWMGSALRCPATNSP